MEVFVQQTTPRFKLRVLTSCRACNWPRSFTETSWHRSSGGAPRCRARRRVRLLHGLLHGCYTTDRINITRYRILNTKIGSGLELTEITDTGASKSTRGGSPVDGTRTIQGSSSAARHHPARRGGNWQCRHDLPLLRNLTAHVLLLAAEISAARAGRTSRKVASTAGLPPRDQGRGGGQDHPPKASLPFWPSQDRYVSQAVSRRLG